MKGKVAAFGCEIEIIYRGVEMVEDGIRNSINEPPKNGSRYLLGGKRNPSFKAGLLENECFLILRRMVV